MKLCGKCGMWYFKDIPQRCKNCGAVIASPGSVWPPSGNPVPGMPDGGEASTQLIYGAIHTPKRRTEG